MHQRTVCFGGSNSVTGKLLALTTAQLPAAVSGGIASSCLADRDWNARTFWCLLTLKEMLISLSLSIYIQRHRDVIEWYVNTCHWYVTNATAIQVPYRSYIHIIYIHIHNHQNLILDFFAAMCKKRPPSFFKATFTSRQVSSALLLEQSPLVPMATRWEAEAHPSIGIKQGNGEDVISLFRPEKGETVGYEVGLQNFIHFLRMMIVISGRLFLYSEGCQWNHSQLFFVRFDVNGTTVSFFKQSDMKGGYRTSLYFNHFCGWCLSFQKTDCYVSYPGPYSHLESFRVVWTGSVKNQLIFDPTCLHTSLRYKWHCMEQMFRWLSRVGCMHSWSHPFVKTPQTCRWQDRSQMTSQPILRHLSQSWDISQSFVKQEGPEASFYSHRCEPCATGPSQKDQVETLTWWFAWRG